MTTSAERESTAPAAITTATGIAAAAGADTTFAAGIGSLAQRGSRPQLSKPTLRAGRIAQRVENENLGRRLDDVGDRGEQFVNVPGRKVRVESALRRPTLDHKKCSPILDRLMQGIAKTSFFKVRRRNHLREVTFRILLPSFLHTESRYDDDVHRMHAPFA